MIGSKFNQAYLQIIKEDYDNEMNNVPVETEAEEKPLKRVTFVTSDDVLIDALNSGFEEVVIFTNAKDEATGEDTVVEVKFGKDSFGRLAVEDEAETDEEGEEETTEEGEEITEEDEEITEEDEAETDEEGEEETTEEGEDIAVECGEWLEDGVCVKCNDSECDGSCKCEKCGSVNCIGDCEGDIAQKDLLGDDGGVSGAVDGTL